jgi:DnaD/phage-associated family protein
MLEYLQLYPETLALIKRYPKDERYDLLEAQTEYACEGKEPGWQEDDTKWLIWEALKLQVDRAVKKVERNKANGSQRKPTEANRSQPKPAEANPSEDEPDPANRISTNYDIRTTKDISTGTTAHAHETVFGPVEIDQVIVYAQQYLSEMTVTHYDELDHYRKILADDLVIHAIDEAVGNGARSWAYVRSILQRYIKEQIHSVAQAKDLAEKRKRQGTPGKRVTAQQYEQRDYSESELEGMAEGL